MRIVRFSTNGRVGRGLHLGDRVLDLSDRYPTIAAMVDAAMAGRLSQEGGRSLPADEARLLAPVDDATRIFCIAQNYRPHAQEQGGDPPPNPVMFFKLPPSLLGAADDIKIPEVTTFLDYEAELGVVIGRAGRDISARRAGEYIGGYTVCNDVTGRDLQPTILGGRTIVDWFSAKAMDATSPTGPWIVTTDELPDGSDLRLQARLNGEVVQDDRTSSMVFSTPQIIEYISRRMALQPGDIIETGTPGGVGKARGRNLRPSDLIEIEVERVGVLRNRVV